MARMQQRVAPVTGNGDANLASFLNSTSLCFTEGGESPWGECSPGGCLSPLLRDGVYPLPCPHWKEEGECAHPSPMRRDEGDLERG